MSFSGGAAAPSVMRHSRISQPYLRHHRQPWAAGELSRRAEKLVFVEKQKRIYHEDRLGS